jgi:hypothetical protein
MTTPAASGVKAVRGDRAARLAMILVIILGHAGVAVVLLSRPPAIAAAAPVAAISVRAVAAPASPKVNVEPAIDAQLAAPSFEIASPAAVAPAACDIAADIGAALDHDPAMAVALSPVAADPRRAIMIWDGHWAASAAVQAIRDRVRGVVAAAPTRCRSEALTGPRLIFVTVDATTVSIAIGSGEWAWQKLLVDDPANTRSADPIAAAQ